MQMYPIIPSKEYGYGAPNQEPVQDDEEAQKRAAIAEALANGDQDENTQDAALSEQDKLSATLEALAPKKYTINPDLANYLTQMRAGKDEAAAQERKQNALFQAFDAVGQARANEWGGKYSPIGDTGDSAQKAAVAAEGAVNTANLKDIQGHIDRRGEIARALAARRGEYKRNDVKGSDFVTKTGAPVFNTGLDENGFPILQTTEGRVSSNELIPKQEYMSRVKQSGELGEDIAKKYTDMESAFGELENSLKQLTKSDKYPQGRGLGDLEVQPELLGTMKGVKDVDLPGISTPVGGFGTRYMNADMRALQADIKKLSDAYKRSITGTAASNAEAESILASLQQGNTSEGEMIEGMQKLKNILQRGKEIDSQKYGREVFELAKKKGIAVAPTTQQSPQSQPKETLKTLKDGRKAYFNTDTKEFIRYAD